MSESSPARRRRLWWTGVLLFLVVAVVTAAMGIAVGPSLKSPAQAVADAAPPPASLVTAQVERRVLAETVVVRGTVVPGESVKLLAPSGLTGPSAVVTAVPGRPGTPLPEGAVFLEVAGAPVIGLVLPFPLYRDITDGMSGPDVREVQKALGRLGFRVPADGVFGAATQDALRRFYRSRGYQVPDQATTPEEAPRDGQQPATGATPTSRPDRRPMLLKAHVVRLDRADRQISAVPVAVGTVLTEPGMPILELDAGATTITALAAPEQAALVKAGTPADVAHEVRGQHARAVVDSVGTEPTQGAGGTGFEIRLSFDGTALNPTPDYTVRVTIGAELDATAVLAVPVTAVYSRADGTTFVTELGQDEQPVDLSVVTGRTAGGWVEIIQVDGTLDAGDAVVVGAAVGLGQAGPAGKAGK